MTSDSQVPAALEPGDSPSEDVRQMTPADIPAGLRLCRASGWNQVARDWEQFLRVNAAGTRVIEKAGTVVGTIATLRYGGFGWVAMVLVDPAERGHGLGTRLLSVGLDMLEDVPCVRLDATPAGERIYRSHSFVEEYRLSRMTRPAGAGAVTRGTARPMTDADLARVSVQDASAFGADRRVMLEWLYAGAPEYAWIAQRRDRVTGYMLGRHGFSFEHLGPIVADDPATAADLVSACLSARGDGPRFGIDATRHAPEWFRWLEDVGFQEQRPFLRMARNPGRFGAPERHFASIGPEFA